MNALSTGATPLFLQLYFYVAIIMMACMVMFGRKQWKRVRYAVVKQFNDTPLIVTSGVMAAFFAIIYTSAEFDNIVQWHESGATIQHADPGLTVGFGILTALLMSFGIACGILYTISKIASYAENGRLHIELDKRLSEGLYQGYDPREFRTRQARQTRRIIKTKKSLR